MDDVLVEISGIDDKQIDQTFFVPPWAYWVINLLTATYKMEQIYITGTEVIHTLQKTFGSYEESMLLMSHLGDPRNAFLLYFPLSYCLHRQTGASVLWLACLSEWMNAILKWLLYGDRPYWWIKESGLYTQNTTSIRQYSLTCETGPGSPSGHAMVTACVLYCTTASLIRRLQPRLMLRCMTWCLYVVFMLAVTVSRCFIATHFPHQVLLGTLIGIVLAILFNSVNIESLQFKHYVASAILIPGSCLLLYTFLQTVELDPGWSITLATKWCQSSEWIHLDTTPFNAVFRDAGSILGFGMVVLISSMLKPQKEVPSHFVKFLHVIMTILFSQVIENFKVKGVDPMVFYFITFVKFCSLVIGVHFITMLYLFDMYNNSNKQH